MQDSREEGEKDLVVSIHRRCKNSPGLSCLGKRIKVEFAVAGIQQGKRFLRNRVKLAG